MYEIFGTAKGVENKISTPFAKQEDAVKSARAFIGMYDSLSVKYTDGETTAVVWELEDARSAPKRPAGAID